MKRFRLSFVIREDMLSTVMSILTDVVTDFSVTEVKNNVSSSPAKKLGNGSKRGKASETRLGKLILNDMRPDRIYSSSDFDQLLKEHGYTPSSSASALSYLSLENKIVRVEKGKYKLPTGES